MRIPQHQRISAKAVLDAASITLSCDQLKDAIMECGINQADLAAILHVTPKTVSHWATGKSPVPRSVALCLALSSMMLTCSEELDVADAKLAVADLQIKKYRDIAQQLTED